jgi:hypothetical protein
MSQLASELRKLRLASPFSRDGDLVFCSAAGKTIGHRNLYWGRPAVVTCGHAWATATADESEREPIVIRDARTSSKASAAAAQHARSLLHGCRRRLLGTRQRRCLADRVCDPDSGAVALRAS